MNDMQVTRTPEMVATEINFIKDQTRKLVLTNSILIGQKLKEAQQLMERGQFCKWLTEAVDFSMSTANNLMRVYEEYGADQGVLFGSAAKSQALENLSYTQAVLLLGVPKEEREDFIEREKVEDISTRELKAKVDEYKKAKAEAEQKADAAAKGEAKALSDNKRLNAELEEHEAKAKELRAQATMSANKLEELEEQNKELLEKLSGVDEAKVVALEQEKAELNKRITQLQAELDKPVTVEVAKEIVEKVPAEVEAELKALRAKVAAQESNLKAEQAKLAYKEKFKTTMNYINELFSELANVEDKEMEKKMLEAFKAVLERSLGVAESKLKEM